MAVREYAHDSRTIGGHTGVSTICSVIVSTAVSSVWFLFGSLFWHSTDGGPGSQGYHLLNANASTRICDITPSSYSASNRVEPLFGVHEAASAVSSQTFILRSNVSTGTSDIISKLFVIKGMTGDSYTLNEVTSSTGNAYITQASHNFTCSTAESFLVFSYLEALVPSTRLCTHRIIYNGATAALDFIGNQDPQTNSINGTGYTPSLKTFKLSPGSAGTHTLKQQYNSNVATAVNVQRGVIGMLRLDNFTEWSTTAGSQIASVTTSTTTQTINTMTWTPTIGSTVWWYGGYAQTNHTTGNNGQNDIIQWRADASVVTSAGWRNSGLFETKMFFSIETLPNVSKTQDMTIGTRLSPETARGLGMNWGMQLVELGGPGGGAILQSMVFTIGM